MTPLANEYLAEIRTRYSNTTDGEWVAEYGEITSGHPTWRVGDCIREEDADFAANAHQDIPVLLAEIERLKAEVEKYAGFYHAHFAEPIAPLPEPTVTVTGGVRYTVYPTMTITGWDG